SHAVLPNQGQELEMPANRSSNERGHRKRKPLDQSTRTDHQRLNPHLNAISGESSRFCNQNFNALSRSLACDVKSVTHGVTLGRGPLSPVERRRPITSRRSKRAALKIVRDRADAVQQRPVSGRRDARESRLAMRFSAVRRHSKASPPFRQYSSRTSPP